MTKPMERIVASSGVGGKSALCRLSSALLPTRAPD